MRVAGYFDATTMQLIDLERDCPLQPLTIAIDGLLRDLQSFSYRMVQFRPLLF
jgi:hypothetical protein